MTPPAAPAAEREGEERLNAFTVDDREACALYAAESSPELPHVKLWYAFVAQHAALLAARRERDASDVLLDAAERGEWAISPQVGGGWVVEQTFPIDISGDASPHEIARTRGTLREALRAALAATPERDTR